MAIAGTSATSFPLHGKVNFTNLSRYSSLSEKNYRRHFLKHFNFPQFNQYFLKQALNPEQTIIAVIDCSFFPNSVRYLVADGYYYRSKFWETVRELNLDFIGKLRIDADLRYLYTGEQKKRGAPRKSEKPGF